MPAAIVITNATYGSTIPAEWSAHAMSTQGDVLIAMSSGPPHQANERASCCSSSATWKVSSNLHSWWWISVCWVKQSLGSHGRCSQKRWKAHSTKLACTTDTSAATRTVASIKRHFQSGWRGKGGYRQQAALERDRLSLN